MAHTLFVSISASWASAFEFAVPAVRGMVWLHGGLVRKCSFILSSDYVLGPRMSANTHLVDFGRLVDLLDACKTSSSSSSSSSGSGSGSGSSSSSSSGSSSSSRQQQWSAA